MNMLLQSKGFKFSNLNWNNAIAKLKIINLYSI